MNVLYMAEVMASDLEDGHHAAPAIFLRRVWCEDV